MAILNIASGQCVQIPAIQLSNGRAFTGVIKASDGETLVIELEGGSGVIPRQVDELCVLTWQADGLQRSCPILIRSKTHNSIIGQVVIQERREAPRVRAEMQITYELVPPDKVREVSDEVMARINNLSAPDNEATKLLRNQGDPLAMIRDEIALLRDRMNDMMAKLDLMMSIITDDQQRTPTKVLRPISVMNCSSSGLGFLTDLAQQEGDYLHLRLALRTIPQTMIDCMGVVVRCSKLEQQSEQAGAARFDVGIRFTHIHESDRERLIHYLFKVQRRILRDMKEARDAVAAH